ncbi:hypothetical protein JW998_15140 [candidate division KSB1 bacterium]|nr:hypothetical protein [candidate division KSB1 bacterium]
MKRASLGSGGTIMNAHLDALTIADAGVSVRTGASRSLPPCMPVLFKKMTPSVFSHFFTRRLVLTLYADNSLFYASFLA